MRPLRIGVNALYLIPGEVGGTEIYLRSLLPAMAQAEPKHQYFVFINQETDDDLAPNSPSFTAVRAPIRGRSRPSRILWEQTALPVQAAAREIDVLFNPGFTAPLLCGCPQVTVFHDMQHKRHPEFFRWFDLPFWRFLLFWSAHVSERIVAVSDATRDDLLFYYRLAPSKVRTATSGVDPRFFNLPRSPENYFLTVSTLHPHKNLSGLLRAFARFRASRPEFRAVVAGLRGFQADELEQLRSSLELQDAVEFAGWLPREEVYGLYMHAFALIFPTLFEGFGLPLVEAMAAGVPAACSRIEPLAGLAGDAALLFEPGNDDAILAAMTALATDAGLRSRLAEAGPRRAAQFSWDAAARATLGAIHDAISG